MRSKQMVFKGVMKPSQNSLFKADTYVRLAAESGILRLGHRYLGLCMRGAQIFVLYLLGF
jgi:hypothetical protein